MLLFLDKQTLWCEKDLNDLSATLTGQENTMVAEACLSWHESEQKIEVTECNLKSMGEAV